MSDFNPDAFIAQNAAPASTPTPEASSFNPDAFIAQSTGRAPAAANTTGFDPDAFLSNAQHEQYGGMKQGAIAALEGVAQGVAGPLAPYLETKMGLATPEAIRGRAEQHPIAKPVGEATGLLGSMLTGVGEGALLGKAGEMAKAAVGLGELGKDASLIAKIGSNTVQQAAEMAVLQGSDEVAKKVINDPNATAQNAVAHVGLAAALGGGTGAFMSGVVSPLWKATVGPQIEQGLKAFTSRLGGVEKPVGEAAYNLADSLEAKTGVPIAPEFKSVINDVPGQREAHSILSQRDTTMAGRAYQKNLNELESNLGAKTIESLGKDPSIVDNMPELDKYQRGRDIGETLKAEIEPIANEIGDRYDAFNNKFKNTDVTPIDKTNMAAQISKISMDEGWHKAESSANQELAENVIRKLSKQSTVEDLKKFMTNLRDSHPYGSDTYQAAKAISDVIKSGQEDIISQQMGASELAGYQRLKQDYAGMMNKFDSLNEHLHVGRYDGPQSFVKALSELSTQNGEGVLNRTLGTNKANVLEQLKFFPETLNKVKQYHIDKLLDEAVKKAGGNGININNLIKNLSKQSPQIKELIASPQQHAIIDAIGETLDQLKDPNHNFSNTARTMDKLGHGIPSPISLIAALLGHTEAGVLSFLGKLGFTEGKDALKLGMMRFLSSDAPINAEGFKAMSSFLNSAYKGQQVLDKATSAVFKPGARVLIDSQMPSAKDIAKLDKLVAAHQANPQLTIQNSQRGQVGHYLPQHQMAMTMQTTQALQYLQNLRPVATRPNPLDAEIKPSPEQEARYNRALEIAQQPAIVMQHLKDGTIQVNDLMDLKAMYPAVYDDMSQKLTNEMVNHQSDENHIPYKTRIGLSLFLAQPMDSTMTPQAIMAAQPKPKQMPQQQGSQPKGQKRGTASLGKSNKSYMTPNQGAEADKGNRD